MSRARTAALASASSTRASGSKLKNISTLGTTPGVPRAVARLQVIAGPRNHEHDTAQKPFAGGQHSPAWQRASPPLYGSDVCNVLPAYRLGPQG